MFRTPLHVGAPSHVDRTRLRQRIESALDRNWLTNDGPMVSCLEEQLSTVLGVRSCIVVSSATVGLQLVAKALRLKGDVIVPAFTFIGTANALAWIGLRPVFCDVDADTHNLCPEDVLRRATPNTSAILGVHLWGRACDIDGLEHAARKVPLFFDAAHAVYCSYNGQFLGRFGSAEVFSLHATKCVNALEGGFIATNDVDLAEELRLTRNFGFVEEDRVAALEINAKMNEFCAAMGLTSLENFKSLREHNSKIHQTYQDAFYELDDRRRSSLSA
jgi:dTDP-4-amino-4,6-dideoxygalactose transaminase